MSVPRTLSDVIEDIRHSWENIPVPARFYIEDLESLHDDNDWGMQSVILVQAFLENADMWQGATAEFLKAELKECTQ